MNSYSISFSIFALILYFIVMDHNVAKLIVMLFHIIKFQYEKTKWWILNNPQNPIVKYLIWRRSMKLAKELQKELAENSKKM